MKLRYFAWVRERIGKPEEEIDPPAGIATIADWRPALRSGLMGCPASVAARLTSCS